MRRNMQKNLGFFGVGRVMLCVGGGTGTAGTIGERRAPDKGRVTLVAISQPNPEYGPLIRSEV